MANITYGIKVTLTDESAVKNALKGIDDAAKKAAKAAGNYLSELMASNKEILKGMDKDNKNYWKLMEQNAGLYMQKLTESAKYTEKELAEIAKRRAEGLATQQGKAYDDKESAVARKRAALEIQISKDKLKTLSKDEDEYWNIRRSVAEKELAQRKELTDAQRQGYRADIGRNIDAERQGYIKSTDMSAKYAEQKAAFEARLQKDKLANMNKDDEKYWKLKQEIMYKEIQDAKYLTAQEKIEHKKRIDDALKVEKQAYSEKMSLRTQFESQVINIAKRAMTYLAIYRSISMISNAMKEWLNTSIALEYALSKVATISTVFVSTYQRIRQMAVSTGKSVVDLANALYEINSAAQVGAKGMQVLEVSSRASVAGFTTVKDAADTITDVLNAYGFQASRSEYVTDVLLKTVEKGKIKWEEYHGVLGRIMPLANNVGVSFEDLMGTLAQLTRKGLKFNEAVTGLRGILSASLKPSNELKKALNEIGKETGRFYGSASSAMRAEGLVGFLTMLSKQAEKSNSDVGKFVNRIQGMNAILSIMGKDSGMETQSIMDSIVESEGYLAEKEAIMRDNTIQRLNEMKASWLDLGLSISERFQPVINAVIKSTAWLVELMGRFPDVIIAISTYVATKILWVLGVWIAKMATLNVTFKALIVSSQIFKSVNFWLIGISAAVAGIMYLVNAQRKRAKISAEIAATDEAMTKTTQVYTNALASNNSEMDRAIIKQEALNKLREEGSQQILDKDGISAQAKSLKVAVDELNRMYDADENLQKKIKDAQSSKLTNFSVTIHEDANGVKSYGDATAAAAEATQSLMEKEYQASKQMEKSNDLLRENIIQKQYLLDISTTKGKITPMQSLAGVLESGTAVYTAEDFLSLDMKSFSELYTYIQDWNGRVIKLNGKALVSQKEFKSAVLQRGTEEINQRNEDAKRGELEREETIKKLMEKFQDYNDKLGLKNRVAKIREDEDAALLELEGISAHYQDKRKLTEFEERKIAAARRNGDKELEKRVWEQLEKDNKAIEEANEKITESTQIAYAERVAMIKKASQFKVDVEILTADIDVLKSTKDLQYPKQTTLERDQKIATMELELTKKKNELKFLDEEGAADRINAMWVSHDSILRDIRKLEYEKSKLEVLKNLEGDEKTKLQIETDILKKSGEISLLQNKIDYQNDSDAADMRLSLEKDTLNKITTAKQKYLVDKLKEENKVAVSEEDKYKAQISNMYADEILQKAILVKKYGNDKEYYERAFALTTKFYQAKREEALHSLFLERREMIRSVGGGGAIVAAEEDYSEKLNKAKAFYTTAEALQNTHIENEKKAMWDYQAQLDDYEGVESYSSVNRMAAAEEQKLAIKAESIALMTEMEKQHAKEMDDLYVAEYEKRYAYYSQLIELFTSNLQNALDLLIDSSMTGAEKWKKIWEDLRNTAWQGFTGIIKDLIASSIKLFFAHKLIGTLATKFALSEAKAVSAGWATAAVNASIATLGSAAGIGLAAYMTALTSGTAFSAAMAAATKAETTETLNDFIAVGNKMYKFRKDDLVIGGTNLGGKGSFTETPNNNSSSDFLMLSKKVDLMTDAIIGGNMILQKKDLSVTVPMIGAADVNKLNREGEKINRIM